MTTIASSTTSPVASVRPNSVSVLIVNPKTFIKKNVPINEIGIVIAGISVVRQSCKNKKITITTSAIAISSVINTSLIDSRTNSLESNASPYFMPGGKCFESSAMVTRARCERSRAFALGSCNTAMPTDGRPLKRNSVE